MGRRKNAKTHKNEKLHIWTLDTLTFYCLCSALLKQKGENARNSCRKECWKILVSKRGKVKEIFKKFDVIGKCSILWPQVYSGCVWDRCFRREERIFIKLTKQTNALSLGIGREFPNLICTFTIKLQDQFLFARSANSSTDVELKPLYRLIPERNWWTLLKPLNTVTCPITIVTCPELHGTFRNFENEKLCCKRSGW